MKVFIVFDNGDSSDTIAAFSTKEKAVQYIKSSIEQMVERLGDKVQFVDMDDIYDSNCAYVQEEDSPWGHSWFIEEREVL